MQHTPYGYDIVDGKAVVDEEKAEVIRKICKNYLAGMSFVNAAKDAGLSMSHCGVKRMTLNSRYLGDEFYPSIISKETADAIEEERQRREKALGRDRRTCKENPEGTVETTFSAPNIAMKYKDPIKQAEYAYGWIRGEVKR